MKITTQEKNAKTLSKKISKKIVKVEFTEKNQTRFIEDSDGLTRIEIKIDKSDKNNLKRFIKVVRRIVRVAQQYQIEKIAIDIDELKKISKLHPKELGSLVAQNLEMAVYEFRDFKTKPKDGWKDIKEVIISNVNQRTFVSGISKGKKIGKMVNECRLISNTPGGDMTPKILSAHARRLSKNTAIKTSALGEKEIKKLKMGAILGVAKGSQEEPKFIIMEYKGGKKDEKPIVLIGKGVTFDSGGINIKPSSAILGMHMDMSGGSAVMATIALVAQLKLKKNVIGLIPSVENMVSGSAFRPGDVLKSMSGKTIEIVNTDAEGRLILADALTYAKKFNPRVVIDIATLTGASLSALGQHASVLMTKDKKLQDTIIDIGEKTGDYVWPLPLWEEYEDEIKGKIADVANLSIRNPNFGGAINGGVFLQQFTKNYPKDCVWAHIDIAPRMVTIPSDNLSSGAAGEPVRLLTRFIEEY
ncbi:MAG TPA: leucyl aminopeptidase [Candidatus Kaiserbacteria bacterium]|nr:leucyl aminopeptidase [Candidatus Kaiserbacteria bacterium]